MAPLEGGGPLRQLHEINIAELSRQHLVDILRGIEAPVMANRVRAQIMKLCSWGVEHGWLETNPAINLPKNKERKRNVILRDEHISAIWPLLQPALKFALATGQRRSEVANMRWSDIRGDVWIQEDTKNGQAHALKLPLFTLNLLPSCREGDYVWVGRDRPKINESTLSHQWLLASKAIGFESKLHDARRTAGSNIAALMESAEAADRVLNHALPGITSRYVLHDFGDIKAKALQLWANKLEGLTWVEPTKTRMGTFKRND
jgi:integrase